TTFTFTVSLSAVSGRAVTVSYATADGTATAADNDYRYASGTLTFSPGQTSRPVTVPVNGDTKYEPDETFAVNLSGATIATLATGRGTGTVETYDPIALPVYDVPELGGTGGPTASAFRPRLAAPVAGTVTADWATADGTALAGGDYAAAGGSLAFSPGETEKT